MEVKFGVSVLEVDHVVTRMIPQVSKVIMTHDFDRYLLVIVANDLEVSRCDFHVP